MSLKHLAKGAELPALEAGKLRIYSMHYCPFAQRTRLVLEHKQIQYETVNVNLKDKPDWFFEKNPLGLVPILEQDDKIVYESGICDDYLDKVYPQNKLMPEDPFEEARLKILMERVSKTTGLFFKCLGYRQSVAANDEEKAENLKALYASLQVFEDALTAKYFGGENPGMMDFHFWPFVERFSLLEGQTVISADRFPSLATWVSAMMELPAVKATYTGPEDHKAIMKPYVDGTKPDYDLFLKK